MKSYEDFLPKGHGWVIDNAERNMNHIHLAICNKCRQSMMLSYVSILDIKTYKSIKNCMSSGQYWLRHGWRVEDFDALKPNDCYTQQLQNKMEEALS